MTHSFPSRRSSDLVMDPARHKVGWAGRDVSLTVTEFLILEALATRPGVVKNRNQLLDTAYSDDVYVDDRTIRSEEHTSELQSLMRISYAVFCLNKQTQIPLKLPTTKNIDHA